MSDQREHWKTDSSANIEHFSFAMLFEFFGICENPFGVTPEARFLYPSHVHEEARASLFYSLQSDRGFVVLVGQPGMGKTTLLMDFLQKLKNSARIAFLFQTQCNSHDFLEQVMLEVGAGVGSESSAQMHDRLRAFLAKEHSAGKRVVIVVDEAQNLDDDVLETVRLLSDFETQRTKLLNIVLSGQPQLAEKLVSPGLLQLRQRIGMVCRLSALTEKETREYIEYRLMVAGRRMKDPLFSDAAYRMIAKLSQGIPRNINNICFHALSIAYPLNQRLIDVDIVDEATFDIDLSKESALCSAPCVVNTPTWVNEASSTVAPAKVPMPESKTAIPAGVPAASKVRESLRSELRRASPDELDALVNEIQEIVIARALEQQRSRLLDLAMVLESGRIAHRRAIRVGELNQLREQAVNELRSQAKSEAPPTLPGPPADQWLVWAWGLQEAQDAEWLQALHNGYPQLDDFIANLERSMWIAGQPPTVEVLPEAEHSAETTHRKPRRGVANRSEESVVSPMIPQIEWKVAESSGGREPRFPGLPDQLRPRESEWNTLTSYDVTPPRTEERSQEKQAQELALLTGLMGSVTDPVGSHKDTVELARTAEASREISVTAVADASELDHSGRPSAGPSTASPSGEGGAAAVANTAELVGTFSPAVEHSLSAEVPGKGSSAQGFPSRNSGEVKRPWIGNSRMLIVLAAGLGLAALATILWWSRATLWRPEKSNVRNEPAEIESNSSVKTVEQKVPDFAMGNPEPKPVRLRAKPTDSSTRANEATSKDQANPQKQEVRPILLSRGASSKRADGGVDPSPPVLPGLVANNAPTIIKNIPVATPGRPPVSPKVSFGLVQASLIRQVNPHYPPQAKQARIEGTIVLQAVIGKDGSVRELRPLSGSPLLIAAAMDAVKQWRYKPYQLNGKPIEADTQISVKFTLNK